MLNCTKFPLIIQLAAWRRQKASCLSASDRLRRMAWPAPIVVFFYVLVVKGCLLDGWPGWFYTLQRVLAECMIALELIDRRLRRTPSRENSRGRSG